MGISVISEIGLVSIKEILHFNATSEWRFTQYPYVTSQRHYLCSWEFMNSGLIIAYVFSENIHKNRISFLIRTKKLQGFVLERGGMKKQYIYIYIHIHIYISIKYSKEKSYNLANFLATAFDLVFFDSHISINNKHNTYYVCIIYMLYKVYAWKICPACYLRITWLIKYIGDLYWILICEKMFNCKAFWFLFWYWNLILVQFEFYLYAAVTKRYQCTQQDVRKIVQNSLPNAPSRVRGSEKNGRSVEEESYPGEIELEIVGSNEDWRFT